MQEELGQLKEDLTKAKEELSKVKDELGQAKEEHDKAKEKLLKFSPGGTWSRTERVWYVTGDAVQEQEPGQA